METSRRHPKLDALCELWESKRKGGALPARADFDVFELRPWLGHLNVIEVIDGGRDYRYRLHGNDLVQLLGMDLTGRRLSDLAPEMQGTIRAEHEEVLATRGPCWFSRNRFNRDADHLRIVKLTLPLAADGETIDMMLMGLYLET